MEKEKGSYDRCRGCKRDIGFRVLKFEGLGLWAQSRDPLEW